MVRAWCVHGAILLPIAQGNWAETRGPQKSNFFRPLKHRGRNLLYHHKTISNRDRLVVVGIPDRTVDVSLDHA